MSKGISLFNPFDLEKTTKPWLGEVRPGSDPVFCQYDTMAHGIRAGFIDLVHLNALDDCHTLKEMANRYAPPSENDTAAYIGILCDRTGYDAEAVIDMTDPVEARLVALAFLQAEQGDEAHLISEQDIDGGFAMAISALRLAGKVV